MEGWGHQLAVPMLQLQDQVWLHSCNTWSLSYMHESSSFLQALGDVTAVTSHAGTSLAGSIPAA